MKAIQTALIIIVLITLNIHSALGCVCPVITVKQGIAGADAVFSGTAKRVSDTEWIVEIERIWKGKSMAKQVTVRDPAPMTSCSRRLNDGERYIIFTKVKIEQGQQIYYLDACNWLLKYPEAGKYLRQMGKGRVA